MALELHVCADMAGIGDIVVPTHMAARGTRAAKRHGHCAPKPASRGFAAGTPVDDFGAGKDGSL